MNKILREILCFSIPIAISLIISFSLGLKFFSGETIFDINIHDTYFILESFYLDFFILIMTIFLFYIFRKFYQRFKSFTSLLILIFSGCISLVLLTEFNGVIKLFGYSTIDNSASSLVNLQPEMQSLWNKFSKSILGVQTFIMVILVYCTFRTAKNQKSKFL